LHLSVALFDANNNVITGRPITFQSSDASIASVDPATGIVTGVGPGPVSITATSEGKTGNVSISGVPALLTASVAGPGGASDNVIQNPVTSKVLTLTVTGGGSYTFSVVSLAPQFVTVSAPTITTGPTGTATVTVNAVAAGSATIEFTATRVGAIPPAAPGSNTVKATFTVTVQ
jgi:adhesin/invasin